MMKPNSPSSPVDKKPVGSRTSFEIKDEKSQDSIPELEKQLEVELKILNGAENLLKTVTNKKDKQEVTKKLEESSKKVETLRDKINQLTRKKETKHGQGYSLTDVDDMIDSLKDLSREDIIKKIEWVNEKIKLEMKVKTGAENLAKVYSAQKDKKLMNEVFDKLMDSNRKINLLKVANQKYKRALKDQTGVPDIKDHKFTDEELKHWKRASLTGRLKVKIMSATNLAPHHKKLEAKCVIKVDSKIKAKTSVKKTNAPVWNEDFDIILESAGELELHVLDKSDLHAILFFDVGAMNQNDNYFEEKTYEMEPRGFITMSVSFSKRASALNRRERVNRRGAVKSTLPTAFIRFMGYGQAKEISTDLNKEKTQKRRTMKIENKSKKAEPQTPTTPTVRKTPKLDDFALVRVLGKGNFGKVMLVEEKSTKNLYAIKVLKKEFVIENDEIESVMSEKRIFQIANKERHPFLVKLHSCFHTEDRIYFVMEYVSGGDLMMHIQRQLFSDSRAKLYAAEVLLGLEYFHKNNVVYRDLKLDNILMDLDGHIKIADYGLCKENMPRGATTNTFCGTPEFMAPEILLEQDYDRAVDWWALGVLIYEMVLAQSPFKGDEEEEIFDSILEGNVHYPNKLNPDTVDIIQKLLERDPKKRLGSGPDDAEEIKRHPYFKGMDWDAILNKKVAIEFKPVITGAMDTSNFDPEFTRETPCLTPIDSNLLEVDQEEFAGFSYAAEWIDHNESFI